MYKWEKDTDGRWGWTQTTQIGVEDTTSPSALKHQIAGNGRPLSTAFVDQITQSYGSAKKPVDAISTTTYANRATTTTYTTGDSTTELHAHDINTFNHATHAIQTENWAAADISTMNMATSTASLTLPPSWPS